MTDNILSWILNHHSMNHKGGVISSKVYLQCLAQGMRNACRGCNTWVWPVHEKATSSHCFILFSSKCSMERMSCASDLDEVNVWMCDWRHGWGQTMLVQLLPTLLTKQKCQKRVSVLVCVLSECWDNSKLVLPHFFLVMFGKGSHCISRDMALL